MTPLLDIAVHIEKSPGIWRCLPNEKRSARFYPAHGLLLKFRRQKIAGVKVRGGSGPAGVFPLSLGRQAVFQIVHIRKPLAVGLGIVPTHKDDCLIVIC